MLNPSLCISWCCLLIVFVFSLTAKQSSLFWSTPQLNPFCKFSGKKKKEEKTNPKSVTPSTKPTLKDLYAFVPGIKIVAYNFCFVLHWYMDLTFSDSVSSTSEFYLKYRFPCSFQTSWCFRTGKDRASALTLFLFLICHVNFMSFLCSSLEAVWCAVVVRCNRYSP